MVCAEYVRVDGRQRLVISSLGVDGQGTTLGQDTAEWRFAPEQITGGVFAKRSAT